MNCVVKIPLKKDAPIKQILNIFKVNKSKERAAFLEVDKNDFQLEQVLSIPYGLLGEDPQIVMDCVVFLLTERYGVPQVHELSGQALPCYYVNNTQTFVTPVPLPSYGLKLNDLSFLPIDEAIRLRNDKSNEYSIGFVESRVITNLDDKDINSSVKDAFERADFILYDHIKSN